MGRKALPVVAAAIVAVAIFVWRYGGHLAQPASTEAGSSSAPSSADEALLAKLHPFIECINRTDTSLQQAAELYMETVKAASKYATPNHKPGQFENFRFYGFKVAPFEQHNEFSLGCAAGLEKAVAAAPASPELDRIGKEYAATLRKLIPVFNQIDRYYEQKDYKDDRFERGRALHEQVTPTLRRLLSLSGPLREEVGRQNDMLLQHRLDAAARAGQKDFMWHTTNFMLQARRGMNGLPRQEKLDEAALAAIEKPVQEAFDAAEAYGVAHPNEKEGYGNSPLWYRVKPSAGLFLQYLKELRRDVGAHAPRRALDDDMKYLVDTFNRLVDNYNTIH